ncbi:MAG: glycosyltransferase family 4 protein [Candidatus Hodarchaeota archaeon]
MKICFVQSNCGSHTERFLRKMEVKHEVHFVSLKDIPVDFCKQHPLVSFYAFNLSLPGFFSIKSFLTLIRGTILLKQIIKKIKPDILFGGWIQTDGFICALANYHPFLLMPWGSDVLIYPFMNIFLKKGSNWVINRADKITCDAEHVKKTIADLSKRNLEDISVIPWGVELDIFNSTIQGFNLRAQLGWRDNIILIMTRSFEPVYNVSTFLNVLPSLCKEFSDLRVILCGTGSLNNDFRNFIRSHGLEEVVHFPGFVPRDSLPFYYAAADIYISSSISDGTSLSLLEAMAMGLPVIVSEIPAILEWVKHDYNGYVFPSQNEEALKSCIKQLIVDLKLRKKFSRMNKQITLRRANWDDNYKKLESLFQELV